jgi:hypothetical protein
VEDLMSMRSLAAVVAALVIGCGGGGKSTPDASHMPDGGGPPDGAGGPPDAAPMTACDMAAVQNLDDPAVGTHTGNSVDLSGSLMNNAGTLDPKPGCTTGATKAEQVSKITAVAHSRVTVTVNTQGNFDAVVYLRTTCLDQSSEIACADGGTSADVAAGTTVFIVVDAGSTSMVLPQAYDMIVTVTPIVDAGQPCDPAQIANVCASPSVCSVATGTPVCSASTGSPTISELDARTADNGRGVTMNVSGADPDGDVVTVHALFKDATGAGVDLNGDGVPDTLTLSNRDVVGRLMFQARLNADEIGSPAQNGAASVDVTLIDSAGHMVTQNAVIETMPVTAGPGGVCGTAPDFCAGEDVCSAAMCAAPMPTLAACTAADMGTAISATAMTMVHIDPGAPDDFQGSCYYISGYGEALLRVVVPGPSHVKFEASTAVAPSSMMLDSYVYLRSTCDDPKSELGCNDDVNGGGGDYRSDLVVADLAPGTYYLVIDGSSEVGGTVASGDIGVAITMTDLKNAGDPCVAGDVCVAGYQCFDPGTGGTCTANAAIVTAECTAAPVIVPGTAITGTITSGSPDTAFGSCAFSPGWPEKYHLLTLAQKSDVTASTDGMGTTVDTVVYFLSACASGATELGCNDDIAPMSMPPNYRSSLTATLDPGTYAVVVDLSSDFLPDGSAMSPSPWSYSLLVTTLPVEAAGQPCDPAGTLNRCDTGLTCSGTPPTCM